MCLESLEVTGTSLTSSCISLCSGVYRSTNGLYEGLLVKEDLIRGEVHVALSMPKGLDDQGNNRNDSPKFLV